MTSLQLAQKYVNLLARSLSILHEFNGSFAGLYSLEGFNDYTLNVIVKLDNVWINRNQNSDILKSLEDVICKAECSREQSRYALVYAICIWMDKHISYRAERDELDRISFWPFIDSDDTGFISIGALNSNYDESRGWINPKFPIRKTYYDGEDPSDKKERRLNNRDAFWGINGDLKNVSYYIYDGSVKVTNVVISDELLRKTNDNKFRIAFAPLSSEEAKFKISEVTVMRDGYQKNAFKVELQDPDGKIHDRAKRDWNLASRARADLVFMPEMLGSSKVDGSNPEHMDWLFGICHKRLDNKEFIPELTIWPSYWNEDQNGASITYEDGSVIGVQYKYFPFIQRGKELGEPSSEEGIRDYKVKEYLLIHIREVHRISILICSEFLSENMTNWSKLLCGCLGVPLLIVPSYTPGEVDFLNDISKYVDYDTTIVWGNCCGAAKNTNKCIGAICKPGSYSMETFGQNKICNGTCTEDQACIFLISLPLEVDVCRETKISNIVRHITDDNEDVLS